MRRHQSTALGEVQIYGLKVAEAVAQRLAESRWQGDETGPRMVYKGYDIAYDPKKDRHQVVVTLKLYQHCTLSQLTIVIRLSTGSGDWKCTYAAEAKWPGIGTPETQHAGFADRNSRNGRVTLSEQGAGKVAAATA